MSWRLMAFDKIREELADKIHLGEQDLHRMQDLFGVERGDPMYDTYPVTESVKSAVERMLGDSLDLDRYDYFVEQTSDE